MSLFTDLLADHSIPRVYLFDFYPWDIAALAVISDPLRVSTKIYGTRDYEDPPHEPWRPHALKGFSVKRTLYKSGQISREADTTYSKIEIANVPDPFTKVAYYDAWLDDYLFDGRRVHIRLGSPTWDIKEFGTVFDGLTDLEPLHGKLKLTLGVRDQRERLNKPLQVRTYKGGERGLELDWNSGTSFGQTRIVDPATNAPNLDITGPMMGMFELKLTGTADQPNALAFLGMQTGATEYPWDIVIRDMDQTDPNMEFRCTHTSGTQQNFRMTAAITHDEWWSVGWRVDVDREVSMVVRNLDEPRQSSDANSTWEALGSIDAARDGADSGSILSIGRGDTWIRNVRIWDNEGWITIDKDKLDFCKYRRGMERLQGVGEMATDYEYGLDSEKGTLQGYWLFDDGSGSTVTDSSVNGYDLTIIGNNAWGFPLEAGPEWQGKPMPVSLGVPRRIKPVLVSHTKLIFQVHDVEGSDIKLMTENAGSIVLDATFGTSGYAATLANLIADSVVSGEFGIYLGDGADLGGTYFKLGSTPSGEIRCNVEGDVNHGIGSFKKNARDMIRKLLEGYGGVDWSTEVDTTSHTALDSSSIHGTYVHPLVDTTVQNVLDRLLLGLLGFSFWGRDGKITFGVFDEPKATADWNVKHHMIIKIKPLRLDPPFRSLAFGYDRTHQTISEANIAGSVDLDTVELYSQPYRWATPDEPGLTEAYAGANPESEMETDVSNVNDASVFADRWMRIYSSPGRRLFQLNLKTLPGLIELGDTVNLTYPRWGLNDGVNFVAVEWADGEKHSMKLWG